MCEILHYALEEEYQGIYRKDQKTHQGKPGSDGRRTDRRAQPTDPWMGAVPPPRGKWGNFSCCRSRNLQSALGLGATKTPQQNALVDQGEILAVHSSQSLGVHRR